MKKLYFLFPFLLSGCDLILDEIYSPGGFPAVQADRYQKAVTFRQHADRYRTFYAYMSVLAFSTAIDLDSAEESIEAYVDAKNSLEDLETAIDSCYFVSTTTEDPITTESVCRSQRSALNFETLSVEVQRDLGDLTYRAGYNLGTQIDIDSFDISSITGLLDTVLDLRSQLPTMRNAAASYREMTHLFARSVASFCVSKGLTEPSKCYSLNEALKDLYIRGVYETQPTLEDGDGPRRLKKILNLTRATIEELREPSKTSDLKVPPESYWSKGKTVLDAYLEQRCEQVLKGFNVKNEKCS